MNRKKIINVCRSAFFLLASLWVVFLIWKNEVDVRIVSPDQLNQYFESGTWVFGISYENTSEKNYAEIYAPDTMDENGDMGKVYAKVLLPCEKNRVVQEVEFDEMVTNVRIRFVQAEGSGELTEVAYRNSKEYNDAILFYFIILASILVFIYMWRKYAENREMRLVLLMLTSAVVVSMFPYMNSFLPEAHDLEFHLARIEGIYQGLKNGEFPVRINSAQLNGYGYASSILYPQMFMYFPAFLRMLGMSLLNSYKLLILAGTLLTVGICFLSFRRILNSALAGGIVTVLYVLGTYRLTNIYCRAAVGELLGTAFFPLIFWGMYEIILGNYKKWILAALGFSLTFQQHILTTEIALIFTSFMTLFGAGRLFKEYKRLIALIKAAIITVLMSLGTIIPIFSLMQENLIITKIEKYFLNEVLYINQIFAIFVKMEGDSMPAGNTVGDMPMSVGWVLLAVVIFYLIYYLWNKNEIIQDTFLLHLARVGNCCVIIGTAAIIMTQWFFPWSLLMRFRGIGRFLQTLQFLFRLLMVPAFLFSVVGGILVIFCLKIVRCPGINLH